MVFIWLVVDYDPNFCLGGGFWWLIMNLGCQLVLFCLVGREDRLGANPPPDKWKGDPAHGGWVKVQEAKTHPARVGCKKGYPSEGCG